MAKPSRRVPKKAPVPENGGPSQRTLAYVLAASLIIAGLWFAAPSLVSLLAPPAPAEPEGPSLTLSSTTVYFFYGEECPHCHDIRHYVENLSAKYPDVDFQFLEIWHNQTNYAIADAMNQYAGETRTAVPRVAYNRTVMVGSVEIVPKLEPMIAAKKKVTRNTPADGVLGTGPQVTKVIPTVDAVYFYGDTCSHCAKVKPVLDELESRYPDLNLTRLEVYNNPENRQVLAAAGAAHGIRNPGVPLVIIGDTVLSGDVVIISDAENAIIAERERLASCNQSSGPAAPEIGEPACAPAATTLSIPLVFFAALVDSINPCGMSVLVFLLVSMAAAGERRRIILAGGAYIAAMFLFHLLMGVGLFSVIALSGFAELFSLIGGAIAIILGIITLTDVIRDRENFLLSIPESKKGLFGTYARMASLPAAFILGILAGILGFTCTGGIYISILGLMGRDMTIMAGLPWLILYNLVYVLPLILVTLMVAYGLSPERAEDLRTQHKKAIRLVIALVLIGLGAIIFLGWFG